MSAPRTLKTPFDLKLCTVSEAADLLGVHPNAVRYFHSRGTLKALLTSTGWRLFLLDDVKALAKQRAAKRSSSAQH